MDINFFESNTISEQELNWRVIDFDPRFSLINMEIRKINWNLLET